VKWFVDEERAAEVEQLRRESTGAVSRLAEVELVSALARRHREGSISTEALESLLKRSAEELASVVRVQLNDTILGRARALLLRHPLRSADAIQLGSCLELRDRLQEPVQFLAFDQRLSKAAVREGLELAL
jgi:uncharacterized protein